MRAIAGMIAIALGASPALAAPPAEITAEQAVELMRAHSPRLQAARAEEQVTAADLVEARIYPNPSLGIASARTVHGADTIGTQQHSINLDIPVLIGRQRGRRERAAEARIASTRAELAAMQADAELAVRRRFVALQAAQQRTAALAGAVDDARTVRTIVEGRASAGASSPYAVERTDLAIASLASRLDEARVDEQVASTELAAAVGIAGWHPRALGELADGELADPTGVAKDHPGLAIDRAARAVALAEETRARGDAIPTPSVGLQAFATTEPSGVALSAGISLPLPLFDRNQGAVARARAQARRAELELAARGVELSTELDRATGALVARRDALARFRTGALERLPRIRTMAEAAYRSGQGGIVELLDAIDAVTEARLRELELLRLLAESGIDVRAASRGR